MSLQLHLSSRSADLLAALRPALSQARVDTLRRTAGVPRPVPVLVPSAQLGDWLQGRLARELGLSMGFEFLQPAAYFGRRPGTGPVADELLRGRTFWSPEQLRWRLLPLVQGYAAHLGHDPARPLSSRDGFAFADLLARQFDRYARFRPDWPERWARGRCAWPPTEEVTDEAALADERWQRQLWREVAHPEATPRHPARLLADIGEAGDAADLPPVFVVGTDLLDPLLLRTLSAWARQGQPVSLYLLLPSLGYLGDIARRGGMRPTVSADTGHPLLAALGQQAVGAFKLLESVAPDFAAWPDETEDDDGAEPPTLLRRIQADIRRQTPPPGAPATADAEDARPELAPGDASVRVHCCHSPRRELEVVRDELLRAFAERPDLRPEDVLVAVTDFDTYAPLAEGILRAGVRPLPIRLTAIPAREANPVAVALLALLRLALGRATASEVIELLNLAAVQHHLDLAGETERLAGLADAIRHSGLTHGLAATGAEAIGTWRVALDRHLAGAWLGPVADARDAEGGWVHPVAADLHQHEPDIARFTVWLTRLAMLLESWRAPAPAAPWAKRLTAAIDTLLYSEALDDHAAALRRLTGTLAEVPADTGLDAGTLLDWLEPQLDNATSLRTSMGGEILFGRLDQLHGLPARVVVILGLQDGAFPRAGRRPAWDLPAHRAEPWDGDPRSQDRQWFLDALLTPSDRLVLTAANRSLRTAHDGPLSACVEDLLRVAADTVRAASGVPAVREQLVVKHRIQPFAREYFAADPTLPRSFDAGAARIAAELAGTPATVAPFRPATVASAPAGAEVTLAELIAFWRNPARAWLRALQLELTAEEDDDTALDDAPLTLDALQAYQVKEAALAGRVLRRAGDAPVASARLAADRGLPPGALGDLQWQLHDTAIRPLAAALAGVWPERVGQPVDVVLPEGGGRIVGEVTLVPAPAGGRRVLVYRGGKIDKNPRYRIDVYVQTLAAALAGVANGAQVFDLELPAGKALTGFKPAEAGRALAALVEGYQAGRQAPLAFAPQTSAALAKALTSTADPQDALETAREVWHKPAFRDQAAGEGTEPAARLAWRDAEPFAEPYASEWLRWAERIAAPLQAWWDAEEAETEPKPNGAPRATA